ncbi:response regulator [Rhodobacteraceae bacterium]|nr:response regulator [Paracoccaceae bacterium]
MHRQRIAVERRRYNKWAADETLEDYALRFTARSARLSPATVAHTAIGALAFLACEAIGATLTMNYGTLNTLIAIGAMMVLGAFIAVPIAINAARSGLDIDLLTRAAGFGYIGSTVTSLVYASFTFVLFAIEASIMSVALEMVLGIPLGVAHLISALIVLPIAAFGIRRISRWQRATQPLWLALQLAPLLVVAVMQGDIAGWATFAGDMRLVEGTGINPLMIGAGLSLLMSLLPQIGEQVDYLRFMPTRRDRAWWAAVLGVGPGWVLIAGAKLALGSYLGYLALQTGLSPERAAQPAEIYHMVFGQIVPAPAAALVLTGVFVCVCQIKINVTNAYAGSLAWSNFFSRLTHNHPGRVVWLVFNLALALMLMELGVFGVIESILDLFAILAVGWLGAIAGDLMIAKPLGWAPRVMEFKRAHLYDINPVGCGAMGLSILCAIVCFSGILGDLAQAFCVVIGLAVAFCTAPLLAWATGGRFYIARISASTPDPSGLCTCGICENRFDPSDMAQCPAYGVAICSLCCSLEGRCHDMCKPQARASQQVAQLAQRLLPPGLAAQTRTRLAQVLSLSLVFVLILAGLLACIAHQLYPQFSVDQAVAVTRALWVIFTVLSILSGVMTWFLVLAHESRRKVEDEFARQAEQLFGEIAAREEAEATAQKARETAEAANFAKSRFLTGLSHEVRSPLNSIYGYAQLMQRDARDPAQAISVIQRSAEHLTDLVDGLQDISQIEGGTLVLQRDPIALPELLDQLADMFRLQAEAKGLGFRYMRQGWMPQQIFADRKRLRQVIINLLSNAVKFTAQGEVSLQIRYRNHMLQIEVADTGIGIAPADLERIFQPFDRGTDSQAHSVPGTGLGLTITKLLVEIMGGRIAVQSRVGHGSQMTVEMLLFAATAQASPARHDPILGYHGPRRRVLLVDDDEDHLRLGQQILAPLGFAIQTARSGAQALRIAPSAPPDLAVLDVTMPGMDGWQLASKLRALWPGLAILMVSGNAQDAQASARRETGADHDAFVSKPFVFDTFVAQVGALLHLDWDRHPAHGHMREPASQALPALQACKTTPETPAPPPASSPQAPTETGTYRAALRQAAEIGHHRGVLRALDAMACTGAPATDIARWRQMADEFNLPAIVADLEKGMP